MGQYIAIGIFLVVIIAVMTEKIHKTAAALAGVMALLLTRVLNIESAISYVDFDTIGTLLGMMIFVAVIKESGIFEYISIKTAKMAKGTPWKILILFMIFTAVMSTFINNVTTILLVAPMTISIARMLDLRPEPFLLTQVFASNIGGTATLIGDPPNIMIGNAAGLSFLDFVKNTGVVALISMVVLIVVMKFIYGNKMLTSTERIKEVMQMDEKKAIADPRLLKKSVIMMVFVIVGFIFGGHYHVEASTVAMTAAVIMVIINKSDVDRVILEAEWSTLLFFFGLFIVVGGMVETGVIKVLANKLISLTGDNLIITLMVILWGSALLSAVLDNIPFVATLIPLVQAMAADGMDVAPLWWAISLGACLGGNGTLVGASANVVAVQVSTKYGYPISFKDFTKVGFPVMIGSVIISSIYLIIMYA
ncbi:MAG: ArsB/NhaD family transporter [Eubacteriales bacterium]|nr:ArsB/NhaD family transporter [Eubacteriales bacterium]MDY3333224.1 ArsB/NhaD family transporter [Gallibacter sp.]